MELDFFSLEYNEVSSNELRDVSGFGVTLGSLYIEAQGCAPVLLENLWRLQAESVPRGSLCPQLIDPSSGGITVTSAPSEACPFTLFISTF